MKNKLINKLMTHLTYNAYVCVNFIVWNHFLHLQETNIGLGTIINMQLTPQAIYF
jgi:hypothetical protein